MCRWMGGWVDGWIDDWGTNKLVNYFAWIFFFYRINSDNNAK